MHKSDSLTTHRAIEIYYEKHHALRHGDLVTLISLKKQYPSMFEKEKDAQIRDIILQAKALATTQLTADPDKNKR